MSTKDAIVEAFVKAGRVESAFKAAKLVGRTLTDEEIDTLIKINEDSEWSIERALLAAELGGKAEKAKDIAEKMVEQMIIKSLKRGKIMEFAKKHHCRPEVCSKIQDEINEEYRKERDEAEANRNGIRGINENLSEQQWLNFVARLIEERNYHPVKFVIDKKDKTGIMVKEAINICLDKSNFSWAAEFSTCFSCTKELRELVINKCFESDASEALMALSLLVEEHCVEDKETEERIFKKILQDKENYWRVDKLSAVMRRVITQDENDSIIIMLGDSGDFVKAFEEMGKRNFSPKAYEGLLSAYIKYRNLEGANKMAKEIGRSLTPNETAQIIECCLNGSMRRSCWDVVEEAISLGTTQEAADKVIRYCIKDGSGFLRDFIEKLNVSQEVIEEVLNYGIEGGYSDYVLKAIELLGRKLTKEEIDSYIKNSLSKGYTNIFIIAKLGASPKAIEMIKKVGIERGDFDYAKKAAELLNQALSQDEIKKIIEVCVRCNNVEQAIKLAELLTD
jgi:hypothetical protein